MLDQTESTNAAALVARAVIAPDKSVTAQSSELLEPLLPKADLKLSIAPLELPPISRSRLKNSSAALGGTPKPTPSNFHSPGYSRPIVSSVRSHFENSITSPLQGQGAKAGYEGFTYQGNLNVSFQSSPTFVGSISMSADPVRITKYFLNTGSIASSASWIWLIVSGSLPIGVR